MVTSREVDPGDLVYSAGSSKGSSHAIIRVDRVDKLRIVTYVPERDAVWLNVGDAVSLEFDAYPGQIFEGRYPVRRALSTVVRSVCGRKSTWTIPMVS